MFDLTAALIALAAMLVLALVLWVVSVVRANAAIVDSFWSVFFLLGSVVYLLQLETAGARAGWIIALLFIWALRLSLYIAVRNHGQPEDRRYRAIREKHQPHYWLKSFFIVFLLQGFLAWVICLPVFAAVSGQTPPGPLDLAALALWLVGMFFEVVGDWQLARFKRSNHSAGGVLDHGLWRYSRHPNYFGEAVLWWGFYGFALSAGHGWTVFAPLLMTFLLLRVSGVALLEKDIADRRPAYRDYVRRTSAFFPWRPAGQPVVALLLLPLLLHAEGLWAEETAWKFRVFLDDREIGYHHFYLDESGPGRQLRSEANFEVKLMFVRLFHYAHENHETWSGGCLQSVQSRTDANGQPYSVEGWREAGQFRVTTGEEHSALPGCVMSFAYWNPDFLEQRRLLNTQNGEYQQVEISEPVPDSLEVRGSQQRAWRYRLEAEELRLDLWYSMEREWLALESEVQGGRRLRYELM